VGNMGTFLLLGPGLLETLSALTARARFIRNAERCSSETLLVLTAGAGLGKTPFLLIAGARLSRNIVTFNSLDRVREKQFLY
jgi:hypothetical protein